MKNIAPICLLLSLSLPACAQLVEYPIGTRKTVPGKHQSTSRVQVVDPVFLPFWDDFSSSDTLIQEGLWLYANSVLLNNGIGIRPPSKNVISFDGADSLGKPYNVNDVLAKGYADRITSQPIRMDLVDIALQNTVYISFFFQVRGRGEPPDPGDQLVLALKDVDGIWENFHVLENHDTLQEDKFYQVILPVNDPKYFHDSFQLRFSNFARLSGPYDTWNVDYIYLNSGRSATDLYYPDRTVSTSLSSLFEEYYSIPIKHFLEDRAANLRHPSFELYNLKRFDVPSGAPHIQPVNYTSFATIATEIDSVVTTVIHELDSAQFPGADLPGLTYLPVTLDEIPPVSAFDLQADSISIKIKLGVATKDNLPIALGGDYDLARYSPMDFRLSDTLQAVYTLASYYAYDDGTAEYAAGLNQAGSFLAFLFDMKTSGIDTLTYIDIYFPEFGDNTSQSLQLQIRTNLSDNLSATVFQQNIVVQRNTMNRFERYSLYQAVPISGSFYVGWKQLLNVPIPVGLDKNTDNGDKIYYNTNGVWVQNTLVNGSIMVRPGFGHGAENVVTGLQERLTSTIYPNPSTGSCFMQGSPELIEAFDMMGRKIALEIDSSGGETRLDFPDSFSGLLLVQYVIKGQRFLQRVMVRKE